MFSLSFPTGEEPTQGPAASGIWGMDVGSTPLFCPGDEQQGDGTGDPLMLTWALVVSPQGGESSPVNYPAF